MEVALPKAVVDELVERGLDPEAAIIEALAKLAYLDPDTVAEARSELATKYLEEGRRLSDSDPVQASEKLYKAAEECVKALAIRLGLAEVLERVDKRGRWTVTDLEKAVAAISRQLGDWFMEAWNSANYLHVWGFHEAKLDAEAVKARMPYIEKMVKEGCRHPPR
ncbi:Archaeal PaREP1/PaREP8 family [Pyrobaculum oguniense TE7]|uniref:Archaeal PaREP1/PaREP8 family n=1 Tax=Pyrobaculum oguniense (strain DSM 13380 / JCM 10595 / TE7) TaxID=698757 RepID=H6Q791_PYROT|nr:Archaeal PaREP1/PaREP8 family [Pyrobaculum oguniense TE7]